MLPGVQWNRWMFLPKCFPCLTSSKFHSLIPSIRIKTLHHLWLWCLYSWAKWVWWIALCPKNYVIAGRSIQLENPFTRCSTHRATVHYVLVNSSSCYSARRLLPPDHNVLSVTYSTFVRSYTARITVYVYIRACIVAACCALVAYVPSVVRYSTELCSLWALIKIDAICVAHCSIDSDGNIDTSTSSRDCVYLQQPRIELDFCCCCFSFSLFFSIGIFWCLCT